MELEEARKILKSYENKLVYEISEKDKEAVVVVLNHLTKQGKMIELMINYLADNGVESDICRDEISKNCDEKCKECIKQYFEKKAEEDSKCTKYPIQ